MASMPGYNVSKGPFAYLETMFTPTDPGFYALAKQGLSGDLGAAAASRFGAADPTVTHFKDDWLDDKYRWANLNPIDVLRHGLTQAINRAVGANPILPIQIFWVCANEPNAFHVYYSVGPYQVTVIVFTPPPLDPKGQPQGGGFAPVSTLTNPENLWVVKKQQSDDKEGPGEYPGPITTLATVGAPHQATIIERQIFH